MFISLKAGFKPGKRRKSINSKDGTLCPGFYVLITDNKLKIKHIEIPIKIK